MTIAKTPAPSKDQFIVRMPAGMRDHLKQLANANRRSMNAELLLIIERGMATEGNNGKQTNMA